MKLGMHHLSVYIGASFSPEHFTAHLQCLHNAAVVILEVPGGLADYAAIVTS